MIDHVDDQPKLSMAQEKSGLLPFYQEAGCWLEQPTNDALQNLPVHIAAKFDNTNFLQALVNTGFSLHSPNKQNEYPIYMALQEQHTASLTFLLEHTYEVWTVTQALYMLILSIKHHLWESFQILLAYDKKHNNYFMQCINLLHEEGYAPLHYIAIAFADGNAHKEYLKFFDYLIKHNVDLHAPDKEGNTILHHIIKFYLESENSHCTLEYLLEFIDILYKKEFNFQAVNIKNETALHLLWQKALSVEGKAQTALKELLKAGYTAGMGLKESDWILFKNSQGKNLEDKLEFLLNYAPQAFAMSLVYPFEENTTLLSLAITNSERDKICLLSKWGFFIFQSLSKIQIESFTHPNKILMLEKIQAVYTRLFNKIHGQPPPLSEFAIYTLLTSDEINFSDETSFLFFCSFLKDASTTNPPVAQAKWALYRKLVLFTQLTENTQNDDAIMMNIPLSLKQISQLNPFSLHNQTVYS